jgi:hypothetical protein
MVYTDIPLFLYLLLTSREMRRKQAVEERVTRVNKSENNKNDCQGTKM